MYIPTIYSIYNNKSTLNIYNESTKNREEQIKLQQQQKWENDSSLTPNTYHISIGKSFKPSGYVPSKFTCNVCEYEYVILSQIIVNVDIMYKDQDFQEG